MFSGAAMEISQSGTGLHIVCRGDKAALTNRRNKWLGRFECYRDSRFMALGGFGWQGNVDIDHTVSLLGWLPVRENANDGRELPAARDPRWCGPEDDDDLWNRMLTAGELSDEQIARLCANPGDLAVQPLAKRNERHERIMALVSADQTALAQLFPSPEGKPFDHSAADLSLMNELAFWTGCDAERMIRLFARSKLADRDKWRNRKDYQNFTVGRAIVGCHNVYTGNAQERRQKQREENERIGEDLGYQIHTGLMSLPEMIEHLWFIGSGSGGGSVANAKTGWCSTIAIARNEYAASVDPVTYIDNRSGKEKTKLVPAIDLWLKDVQRKRVDAITWKPGGSIVCDVPEQPGATGFNTWRGLIKPKFADHMLNDHTLRENWLPTWHNHLAYLVPVESERRQFEQWLAHIVQHPGDVPQTGWCLIAANTGIGRNWLGSVLVRVLRGHVLANAILDSVLAGTFNGRMSRKLLIVVDEARAGMRGTNAWQHSEKLKTIVNPELREINEKHGLQRAEHNAMRWLVFSNHWDALPIERNDRRWNVVENPTNQQHTAYYDWLYEQLYRAEFIAAVWAHLAALPLQGFNLGANSIKNHARERMLDAIASELELSLQEFKETWPAPVAQFKDVESFVKRKHPTNAPNRNNIERDLGKVGIIYCERAGKENTRFIITHNDMTEQTIRNDPKHWLQIATDAAAKFTFGPQLPGLATGATGP
jgi:primase-polymerase (primpol)-like protein